MLLFGLFFTMLSVFSLCKSFKLIIKPKAIKVIEVSLSFGERKKTSGSECSPCKLKLCGCLIIIQNELEKKVLINSKEDNKSYGTLSFVNGKIVLSLLDSSLSPKEQSKLPVGGYVDFDDMIISADIVDKLKESGYKGGEFSIKSNKYLVSKCKINGQNARSLSF